MHSGDVHFPFYSSSSVAWPALNGGLLAFWLSEPLVAHSVLSSPPGPQASKLSRLSPPISSPTPFSQGSGGSTLWMQKLSAGTQKNLELGIRGIHSWSRIRASDFSETQLNFHFWFINDLSPEIRKSNLIFKCLNCHSQSTKTTSTKENKRKYKHSSCTCFC